MKIVKLISMVLLMRMFIALLNASLIKIFYLIFIVQSCEQLMVISECRFYNCYGHATQFAILSRVMAGLV